MATISEKIYRRCPPWLQSVGVSAMGVGWKRRRMGKVFLSQIEQFASRDFFTADQWRRYQTEHLRDMLRHCYREVPFYRRKWSQLGIEEGDLETFELEDLPRLPITEKEELRSQPEAFLAASAPVKRLFTYMTSGTTGTPLRIRLTSETHQTVFGAYEARVRGWAGVNHNMSRANIGAKIVVPPHVQQPPFWRYNVVERQVYFSSLHVTPANAHFYAEALNRYRPDYLMGFASAHFYLARFIEEAGLPVHSPRAIITSSEKLSEEMRATLSRVYRCPVFEHYSSVEQCCHVDECEQHRLHVCPDIGVVELVDAQGRPASAGAQGQVIATGLINRDQPLIRYNLGDLAIWSDERCPCGRAMPVIREIVGRLEDTIIGPDGREIVRFDSIFKGLRDVQEAQVVQEEIDRFTVRVVVPRGLLESDADTILTRLRECVGPVRAEIEKVEAIERTARGKFKAVVSKLPDSGKRARPEVEEGFDRR